METSKTIHSFKVSVQKGQTLLTAQEYPWSVLQVIPTSAEDFDKTVEKLKERGMVAPCSPCSWATPATLQRLLASQGAEVEVEEGFSVAQIAVIFSA